MRYSAAATHQKREEILTAASKLFRERGFGVSIDELMGEAGLTHGSFYSHFGSKQKLAAEVIDTLSSSTLDEIRSLSNDSAGKQLFAARYLSDVNRRASGFGCMMASLGPEIAREPALRKVFTRHLSALIRQLTSRLPWGSKQKARTKAIVFLSSLVGALMLSRATDDEQLAREILEAVRTDLGA